MRIALLRHGPTDWNAQGRIQGHTDTPLSEAGRAKMSGLRLPPEFAGARLFASPSIRARQTAAALGLIEPALDARLMEQNWGRWEGLTTDAIRARDGADCFARAGLKQEFRPPGGESTAELMARVAAFLTDTARTRKDAVAVAHFGVLRAAYTLATGWAMETIMPQELDVAKILVLALAEDGTPAIHQLNAPFVAQDGRGRSL
ncbi:MAG TPA: histidine phosphatase family protein [Rhizomicrobium sp.]|nr:histidine phosphatase family protein [Rhizomicrobium sp.]